jgi:hypothetical protein
VSEWNKAEAVKAAMNDVIAAARRFVASADEFWPDYPYAVGESLDALDSAMGNLAAIDDVDELREALKDQDFQPILPPYEG